MVFSVQQIKYEILAYMKELGGEFGDYYVGIAADPKKTLLDVHNVDEAADPWLYKQALTFYAAQTGPGLLPAPAQGRRRAGARRRRRYGLRLCLQEERAGPSRSGRRRATPRAAGPRAVRARRENDAIEEGRRAYMARDFGPARALWMPLAEAGNAEAQAWVGSLYANGDGVQADAAAAFAWYLKSAEGRNALAQSNIGAMYAMGNGVAKDMAEAVRCCAARLAAAMPMPASTSVCSTARATACRRTTLGPPSGIAGRRKQGTTPPRPASATCMWWARA